MCSPPVAPFTLFPVAFTDSLILGEVLLVCQEVLLTPRSTSWQSTTSTPGDPEFAWNAPALSAKPQLSNSSRAGRRQAGSDLGRLRSRRRPPRPVPTRHCSDQACLEHGSVPSGTAPNTKRFGTAPASSGILLKLDQTQREVRQADSAPTRTTSKPHRSQHEAARNGTGFKWNRLQAAPTSTRVGVKWNRSQQEGRRVEPLLT